MNTAESKKNCRTARARSQGFTLVEALVIMGIVAILATLSGTTLMRWIAQSNLSRASRTIVSMAQHARVEAIKRNASVSLNCTSASNSCAVWIDGNATRRFDLASLQGKVALGAPNPDLHVLFRGKGTASSPGSPGNAWSATVANSAGNRTVTVRSSGSIATQ